MTQSKLTYLTLFISIITLLSAHAFNYSSNPKQIDHKSFFVESSPNPTKPTLDLLNKRPFSENKPLYLSRRVTQPITRQVHSPSICELDNGELFTIWYGGHREGSKDVAIYGSRLNTNQQFGWQDNQTLVTRAQTQTELNRYIKKLGNAVVAPDNDGRLWLFYVSVSLGGWAGSSINAKISDDSGLTWSPAQKLITSPFLNISTLVKSPPVFYQHGSIGLPVYHEFIGEFVELLEINPSGKVNYKHRVTSGRTTLQPVMLVQNEKQAQAFLRHSGNHPEKRVLMSSTDNGGRDWGPAIETHLPNPDAAIAGLRIQTTDNKDVILMVFNNSFKYRNRLSLSLSQDNGKSWSLLHDFEHEPGNTDYGFSYPYLIQSSNGHMHLVYSWKREYIKHIEFNLAWINSQMANSIAFNPSPEDPEQIL